MEFGMGLNGMSVKMSDFPERINISPAHRQTRDDDFYLVDRKAFPGKGIEYIRADVAQAMVAAAYEDAINTCEMCPRPHGHRIAEAIRVDVTTDARAALDAMLAKAREDALREAASLSWLCFHKCDVEVDVVTTADILALIPTGEA
jgi:hypothetical protein